MKIDKLNDEFIVNCTNNSKEERQQVYKFLVDNRNYSRYYLTNSYPIIVCNKKEMNSNHYNIVDTQKAFPNYPIYTFEQFKKMYVNANNMKIYTIEELRNAPIQIRVYSKEQAIKLAYAAGYYTDWKPLNAKYPIYCYLDEQTHPSWNPFPFKNKLTIIEFNQIKDFMETKKIIGYKLVKPEYEEAAKKICHKYVNWEKNNKFNLSTSKNVSIPRLKEAGVLDLWFEPVYEEEQFKVGDFIALEYNTHRFSAKKGYVAKVIKEFDGKYINIKWITDTDQIDGEYYPSDFRKATPEEIEEANKKIVKMYSSNKGEFEIEVVNGKAYYRPENKHLPKEWIRDIINSYGNILIQKNVINPYNVEISSINVGCYHNCKKEDWENVYKLLK